MSVIAKLFRQPGNAEKAIASLQARGYSWEKIGLLGKSKDLFPSAGGQPTPLELPQAGECWAQGNLTQLVESRDPGESLSRLLNLSQEALDYYQFGLALGGVLVSVQADGENLEGAVRVLREADSLLSTEGASPGFAKASAMTETDPVDAKMTGDFRRY